MFVWEPLEQAEMLKWRGANERASIGQMSTHALTALDPGVIRWQMCLFYWQDADLWGLVVFGHLGGLRVVSLLSILAEWILLNNKDRREKLFEEVISSISTLTCRSGGSTWGEEPGECGKAKNKNNSSLMPC